MSSEQHQTLREHIPLNAHLHVVQCCCGCHLQPIYVVFILHSRDRFSIVKINDRVVSTIVHCYYRSNYIQLVNTNYIAIQNTWKISLCIYKLTKHRHISFVSYMVHKTRILLQTFICFATTNVLIYSSRDDVCSPHARPQRFEGSSLIQNELTLDGTTARSLAPHLYSLLSRLCLY